MPELRVTITVDGSDRSTVHTKATDVGPREAEVLARKALTALATEVAAMDRCPFHQAAPPIGAAGEAEAALSATDELTLSRLLAERREMLEALKACRLELYWCAKQLAVRGAIGHPGDSVSRAIAGADAILSASSEDKGE